MSVYLHIDGDDDGEQVASSQGWGDFRAWVESLDDSTDLKTFIATGFTANVGNILQQIAGGLDQNPPSTFDVSQTANGFIKLLNDAGDVEFIEVSQGLR
jgi:hypothetical protein